MTKQIKSLLMRRRACGSRVLLLTAAFAVFFAAPYVRGEDGAALSVHLPLPAELTKESVPLFTARERDGANLFQKRHLEKLVTPATKRVALVYFATWCLPCAKGAAMIRDSKAELEKNGVLAIYVNVGEKDVASIQEWIKQHGDPELPLVLDNRSNMAGAFGLMEKNGTIIMPKVLILNEKLKPLFLLGTEGNDFPEIIWRHNP